jgi:hypothetical protein
MIVRILIAVIIFAAAAILYDMVAWRIINL